MNKKPIQCLTQQQITGYISKAIPADEIRAVELHIEECPFCADAVEGFSFIEPSHANAIISGLNNKIDERVNKKNRTPIFYLSIAASLTGIIISSFLIKNIYFDTTKHVANVVDTMKLNSSNLQGNLTQTTLKKNTTPQPSSPAKDQNTAANSAAKKPAIAVSKDANSFAAAESNQSNTGDEVAAAEMHVHSKQDIALQESAPAMVSEELKSVGASYDMEDKIERETIKSNVSKAAAAPAALDQSAGFREKKAERSNNQLDCFQMYQKGDFKNSIKETDLQLSTASGIAKEKLLLNKAKCLIALKENQAAKKTLKELVKLGGQYKDEAEHLLNSLK